MRSLACTKRENMLRDSNAYSIQRFRPQGHAAAWRFAWPIGNKEVTFGCDLVRAPTSGLGFSAILVI
jgi:hypothetical protein